MKQKKKMHLSKEFNQYICQIDNSQLNIYRHIQFVFNKGEYVYSTNYPHHDHAVSLPS